VGECYLSSSLHLFGDYQINLATMHLSQFQKDQFAAAQKFAINGAPDPLGLAGRTVQLVPDPEEAMQ
jgi:hypothetical protein